MLLHLMQAVHGAGAGVIGEYDSCAFRAPGTGSFRSSDASNPHIGSAGEGLWQHFRADVERLRAVVSC